MQNKILIKNKITQFKKKIEVSSDKSLSIRAVLLASQAVGKSKLSKLLESEDVLNTLKAIKKLGIKYKKKGKIYEIHGKFNPSFKCYGCPQKHKLWSTIFCH